MLKKKILKEVIKIATDFLYTPDGDLYLDENGPVMISGLDEIKQALTNRLKTPQGNWLDEDVGMDYNWLVGGYDENAGITAIEETLLQDQRVTEILKVEPAVDKDNHRVVFYIAVNTTLGVLDFTKEVNNDAIN